MKKPLLTLLLGSCFAPLFGQEFKLVKDINPAGSANISYLTKIQNRLFFGANNGTNGMELWSSDGSSGGTQLVKDINPGSASSSIGYLTPVDNTLFFVASNGTNGVELWKSDGTESGTSMVKDIRSGSASSYPSALAGLNGSLYFSATDGINGSELWKSNGTAAGTTMLRNIHSSGSSSPQFLVSMGNYVYFSADDGVKGRELWKTDGTSAGTVLVKDIWPGIEGSGPANLVVVGSILYFSANDGTSGQELWRSDGTSSGTYMVKDIWSGTTESYPYNLRNVNGTLYFSADNGSSGMELWKSDGTALGTVMVKDVWPGTPSGANGNFAGIISRLIFTGNDGVNGDKNWESDGSSSGTKISDISIEAGSGTIREVQEAEGIIYASVQESSLGRELYALEYSVVLPLQFLEFSGKKQGRQVQLNWRTCAEENAEDFDIERSANGRDFTSMGSVAAVNRAGTHRYSFVDQEAAGANSRGWYYRLKQNDQFGRYSYSSVIFISFTQQETVALYPVPAADKVQISGMSGTNENLTYRIYDAAGKLVQADRFSVVHGTNLEVPIHQLADGVYFLVIPRQSGDLRLRLVKRR
jgi:ELWxxDGT repeat protein